MVAVKTSLTLFLVLVISQPVLAYLTEDVQRLLKTNSCEQCDLSQANCISQLHKANAGNGILA